MVERVIKRLIKILPAGAALAAKASVPMMDKSFRLVTFTEHLQNVLKFLCWQANLVKVRV